MRKIIDLYESYDGDLFFDNNDIMDTGENYDVAALQLLRTILNTPPGDCSLYPFMGIDFSKYEGRMNSPELADAITKDVISKIESSTPFFSSEINVETFPISENKIAMIIKTSNSTDTAYAIAYDTSNYRVNSLTSNNDKAIEIVTQMPPVRNTRQD